MCVKAQDVHQPFSPLIRDTNTFNQAFFMTTQRPWPQRRRLQAGQLAELTIVDCKSGATTFIYETAELIEAHNWTSDGDCLIFNADGRIFPC